jgi:fatty acid desaturase
MLYSETKVLYWDELLELIVPALMFIFSGKPLSISTLMETIICWFLILGANGFFYAVNSLNTGHHSPTLVHEGDEFKSLDFGLYQLATTVDRIEPNLNLFMSLAFFGDHSLHHLFPVLDHAILPYLQEEFLETCMEFKIELRAFTLFESIVEQYKQLLRTETTRLK